jgi:4-alpha-glucanotransferase
VPARRAGRPGGAGCAGRARRVRRHAGGAGRLAVIAEDLGVITPAVRRLRDELGFPGMVVLQFGFDPSDPHGPHRPEHHHPDQVLYTGTHDNDTLRGWWETLPTSAARRPGELARAGIREREPWWALVRLALSSPARLCMLQVQDVLGLGSEARMNFPGRATGQWRWRMEPGQPTARHARRLRAMTEEAGRA